jgi:hypothetical protein
MFYLRSSNLTASNNLIFSLIISLFFGLPVDAQTPQAHLVIDEPEWFKSTNYFPDLGMSLTRGYAPFPVFFEGWQSSPREDLIRWSWDFGTGTDNDPGGRYFEGFNAAHVFETPGLYQVRLRVMNKDKVWSSYANITIEVLARSQGTTFYVNSEIGNDSYTGQCQDVQGNCGAWRSATKANRIYLFRK